MLVQQQKRFPSIIEEKFNFSCDFRDLMNIVGKLRSFRGECWGEEIYLQLSKMEAKIFSKHHRWPNHFATYKWSNIIREFVNILNF